MDGRAGARSEMPDPRPFHRDPVTWLAGLVALLIVVVVGGAWYAAHVLRALPAAAAAQGHKLVQEVADLAHGFKTGTVQRRFSAYTTRLEGTNYLQVATLQQTQVFELEDRTAVLWGTVELPPVVVRASAPVQYTYFVDLEGTWQLELRDQPGDRRVLVRAPPVRFNKPAVDVSQMRWKVLQGSLLRDESEVVAQLRREITGRTAIQATANLPQVRATARAQVARFVSNWLLRSYPDAETYKVQVFFADEAPAWQAATRPNG
jgi:hypothetical protein